jgi:ABC-type uncharacterized transport system substrate-binding protein
MRRREFISFLGGALATPFTARAQRAGKVYRVGVIAAATPVPEMEANKSFSALVQGLRALGYVGGHNLILESRSAEGRLERAADIVAELVHLKTDVIVTAGNPAARAAKAVTKTIPIVAVAVNDFVDDGLVQSLARPGGNITGLTIRVGPEIEAKRLELVKEILPGVSRVAYLGSKENGDWESPWGKSARAAARTFGLTLIEAEHTTGQLTSAFALISSSRSEVVVVAPGPPTFVDRGSIVDLAARSRLPTIFAWREGVEGGGLMSYGINLADLFRRAAGYVDKILKGANPGELPIEQPTKFELVINLKTAKALGLTIPPPLLARADEVIE